MEENFQKLISSFCLSPNGKYAAMMTRSFPLSNRNKVARFSKGPKVLVCFIFLLLLIFFCSFFA